MEEWWTDSTGAAAKKIGGRFASAASVAVSPTGASFAVGQFALARSADGAGGLKWELAPFGVTGAGTNQDIVRWNGTSAIQDSAVSISDLGLVIAPGATLGAGFGFSGGPVVQFTNYYSWGLGSWISVTGSGGGVDGTPGGNFAANVIYAGAGYVVYDGFSKTGVSGTLGPGAVASLGIITNAGSGSFATTGANTFVAGQTIQAAVGTSDVALTVQAGHDSTGGSAIQQWLDHSGNVILALGIGSASFTSASNAFVFNGTVTATTAFSGPLTGNASTATALATGRAINGVTFDGTAAITVTAAAGTLTGATLNSTVVTSSLTSVGTLTGGATGAGFTIALSTSTVTGTLPAARLPSFGSGDVSFASGGGAGTIAASAVTLAKMADVATATVFYRKTAGTGAPEVNTLATLKTDLGLTGTNSGDQTITLTSDVTGSGTGSFATTIASGAVTLAKMASMTTASLIYRKTAGSGAPEVNTLATLKTDLGLTGTNSGDQTITLTGDVTGSGTSSFATTVTHIPAGLGLRGHIDGLTLSKSANLTLGIAAGSCRDDTDSYTLSFSAMTKTLGTGAWTAGSGNEGHDTATSVLVSTSYHVWAISKAAGANPDILLSTSATAPTLPATYTLKRRIGTALTDAGGAILLFHQYGDEFLLDVGVQDVNTTVGTTATLYTLSVPTGIQVWAQIASVFTGNKVLLSSPDQSDEAPSGTVWTDQGVAGPGTPTFIRTNTSGQIRGRGSGAGLSIQLRTIGWRDPRGRDT